MSSTLFGSRGSAEPLIRLRSGEGEPDAARNRDPSGVACGELVATAGAAVAFAAPPGAYDRPGKTERVSVSSSGAQSARAVLNGCNGNGNAGSALSASGRYVAFLSDAPNLVAGDTNQLCDVFVHDRTNGGRAVCRSPPRVRRLWARLEGWAAPQCIRRAALMAGMWRSTAERSTWYPATPTCRPMSSCTTERPARRCARRSRLAAGRQMDPLCVRRSVRTAGMSRSRAFRPSRARGRTASSCMT